VLVLEDALACDDDPCKELREAVEDAKLVRDACQAAVDSLRNAISALEAYLEWLAERISDQEELLSDLQKDLAQAEELEAEVEELIALLIEAIPQVKEKLEDPTLSNKEKELLKERLWRQRHMLKRLLSDRPKVKEDVRRKKAKVEEKEEYINALRAEQLAKKIALALLRELLQAAEVALEAAEAALKAAEDALQACLDEN